MAAEAGRGLPAREGEPMEDDNRNWILAIVISFAVLIIYQIFFADGPSPARPQPQTQNQQAPLHE